MRALLVAPARLALGVARMSGRVWEWIRGEKDDRRPWGLYLSAVVLAAVAVASIVWPLVLVIQAGRGSM